MKAHVNRILAVAPLGLEIKLLIEAFRTSGLEILQENTAGVSYYEISSLNLILLRGAHGKVACALKTQQALLALPQIKAVICLGAGGSLNKEVRPGDLVIAEKTLEHDYHEKFSKEPYPEFLTSKALLERLRKVSFPDFRCHFGTIASGDEDIVESSRAEELALHTGALAVAWEGAGVARAAQMQDKDFLEIRGITDIADADAFAHFQLNLKKVMERIAVLLQRVL